VAPTELLNNQAIWLIRVQSATCKARHTRCDGKSPTCANCERLGLQCQPSDFINQSAWSGILAAGPASGSERGIQEKTEAQTLPPSSHTPSQISFQDSTAHSGPSFVVASNDQSTALSQALSPDTLVELNDESAFLLQTFSAGLATWMDVFDFDKTYERQVTRRALHSQLLIHCICAFTAKNLSLLSSGEVWDPISSRYYGEVCSCFHYCSSHTSQTRMLITLSSHLTI
jgi:hypothetical protein